MTRETPSEADYAWQISGYDLEIGLDPTMAMAYWLRGMAYERMGDKVKAEADFATAKKLAGLA